MPLKLKQTEKWYAAGLHFECTQCGNCCGGVPGYVWVTEPEILTIAQFLNMTVEDFSRRFLRRVHQNYSLIELPNYDCVFLQRTEQGVGCRIYSVRPQQCRTWPFWKTNLTSSSGFLGKTQRCPGINRGKCFTSDQINQIADDSPC